MEHFQNKSLIFYPSKHLQFIAKECRVRLIAKLANVFINVSEIEIEDYLLSIDNYKSF